MSTDDKMTLVRRLRAGTRTRLGQGIVWNLASLGFIGLGGFLVNVLIARHYGPEALGVFNQVMAIYLIAAQLSVGGITFSTLKFASDEAQADVQFASLTLTALLLALVPSTLVATTVWLGADVVARLLHSPDLGTGLRWVAPGLAAFALNKVLFAALNGRRQMRLFATLQSLRYLSFLTFLALLVVRDAPASMLPALFSGTELLLFLALGGVVLLTTRARPILVRSPWWQRHVAFAIRAWPIGILMDVNTKVDVLMLGYFDSDRSVGIYSYSLLLVEAIAQLAVVVQNNLNPILATLAPGERRTSLRRIVGQTYRYFAPLLLAGVLVVWLLFPVVTDWLMADPAFADALAYFLIIAAGMLIAAGVLPVNMALNQFGLPAAFTLFIAMTVLCNLLLNALLIPPFGPLGAACATGLAFAVQVPLLFAFVRLFAA